MNIGVNLSGGITDEVVLRELEAVVTGIQAGWNKEHRLDGGHSSITSIPPDPSMFSADTGASSMALVASPTFNTVNYRVQGDALWLQVLVGAFVITNTPSMLRVLLPENYTAVDTAILGMGWCDNAGTSAHCVVSTIAGSKLVQLALVPSALWANGSSSIGFTSELRVTR